MAANALNYLTIATALVALMLLASKRLRQSSQWRATVTPLASIIGSGFLIVAPLLHSVLGKWALAGMIFLSILAYAIGSIIRFNIVPGSCLMTNITCFYFGMWLPCYFRWDHFKVHHVMTWWRLMTLNAVLWACRRMSKLSNIPGIHAMTLHAFITK